MSEWDHEFDLVIVGSGGGGMYATGNTSASVMGNEYAGPGATIGPSIGFGYIAARHAAARSRTEDLAAPPGSV